MERINLTNITKTFGDRKLFEISNLIIQDNEKIGIVGKNGSGKSTFLNITAKEIKPDTGNIKINGKLSYIKQLDNISANQNIKISGGEQMLKAINTALNENPDILLADEPSSNLDIFNIGYLIKKLTNFKGTLLLISHDRELLNKVCNYIIEIDNGKLTKYTGNYTSYKEQKENKLSRERFEYEQYIKEKSRLEKAINISKNTAKSVRKAPKRMGNSEARLHKREATEIKEKLEGHTKSLETRLNHLEEKDKPNEIYSIHFVTPESNMIKNKFVVKADNFSLKIDKKILLDNTSLYIPSNKKIALIGKNGIGKTSLVKEIINSNNNLSINPNLNIGYFSQNLGNLDENETIIENLMKDSIQSETTIRNVLGCLQIKGNKIFDTIKNLSGGEKVKVSISKLLASNANFLILDEPTNFLDIEAIEGLEILFKHYKGTILLISHDREFVDNVCDYTILFKDKKLIQFDGNYSKYLEYENNKKIAKTTSNDKILLEFKLTKLDTEISFEKDMNKKLILEEQRKEILIKLNESKRGTKQ